MPGYEVMTLFKQMARPDMAAGIKRVAEELIKQGTLIRRVESLGERKLTFRIKEYVYESCSDNVKHDTAHYIVVPRQFTPGRHGKNRRRVEA